MASLDGLLERPPLDDLLFRNRCALVELKSLLRWDVEPESRPEYADDIWMLRYVLSSEGGVTAAKDAVDKAIKWRREHEALVAAARTREAPPGLSERELRAIDAYMAASFTQGSQHGEPMYVTRIGSSNLKALMDVVGEEGIRTWLHYVDEVAFQYCEAATRARGFLVRLVVIQDTAGSHGARAAKIVGERRFADALDRVSSEGEWLRPQLRGLSIVFNPPTRLKMASSFGGKMKRNKNAFSHRDPFVHPGNVGAGGASAPGSSTPCPFAMKLLGEERALKALPAFLGGLGPGEQAFPARPRSEEDLAGHSRMMSALAALPPSPAPPDSGLSSKEGLPIIEPTEGVFSSDSLLSTMASDPNLQADAGLSERDIAARLARQRSEYSSSDGSGLSQAAGDASWRPASDVQEQGPSCVRRCGALFCCRRRRRRPVLDEGLLVEGSP